MLYLFSQLWLVLWLAVLVLSGATTAYAADWHLIPSAKYRFMYDDNYLLTIDNPIRVNGQILDLDAKFKYESEKNTIDLVPRVSVRRINENQDTNQQNTNGTDQVPDYDREDYYLKLLTAHATQWMDIQFSGNAISDSTELDPEQFNFNQTQTLATRNRWDVSPTFIFQLSELTNMNIGVNYSDVSYKDTENISSLNDYTNGSVFLGFGKQFSERTAFTLTLYSALLQSDSQIPQTLTNIDLINGRATFQQTDIHNETTTYSLQGEITYEFSETETLRFMVGGRRTGFVNELSTRSQEIDLNNNNVVLSENNQDSKIDSFDSGYLFDFEYTKYLERNQWHVMISRFVDPNGAGRLSQRDKVAFRANHQLFSNVSLNLGLGVTRIDDLLELHSTVDTVDQAYRVFSTGNIGATWLYSRDWRFGVAYLYRSNYYTGPDTRGRSNSANISVIYAPRSARPFEIY